MNGSTIFYFECHRLRLGCLCSSSDLINKTNTQQRHNLIFIPHLHPSFLIPSLFRSQHLHRQLLFYF